MVCANFKGELWQRRYAKGPLMPAQGDEEQDYGYGKAPPSNFSEPQPLTPLRDSQKRYARCNLSKFIPPHTVLRRFLRIEHGRADQPQASDRSKHQNSGEFSLHAFVHLSDTITGRESIYQATRDLPTVYLSALLALWIALPTSTKEDGRDAQIVVTAADRRLRKGV
jgi:hypothetical protein